MRSRTTLLSALCAVVLGACGNPYAVKISDVDYEKPAVPAEIQVSDIKLYRREALINERREEVAYLNEQLQASKALTFAPEIVRDLETITSLSASLGLKFDPAAGENYRNARKADDIEQEIELLRLQLELDQLKRNAELLRTALEGQTAVSDSTLGAPTEHTTPPPGSTVTAPPTAALTTAISALQASLATRLDATTTAPRPSTTAISPLDQFQDRATYRSHLNHARNQANLDELHDVDGSALLRMSFNATLPPAPKGYDNTVARLTFTLQPPSWNEQDIERLYRLWLDHVNENHAATNSSVFAALSAQRELFQTLNFYYSSGEDQGCLGFLGDNKPKNCKLLRIAAPYPNHPTQVAFELIRRDLDSRSIDQKQLDELVRHVNSLQLSDRCSNYGGINTLSDNLPKDSKSTDAKNLLGLIEAAQVYRNHALFLEIRANRTLARIGETSPRYTSAYPQLQDLGTLEPLAQAIDRLESKYHCPRATHNLSFQVPERFKEVVTSGGEKVSVYNLEPTELVQQVSTTARAAEAIGLAAAINGSIPTSGFAGDGNLAFARSATGKVDARERVPLVQAFAQALQSSSGPSGQTFGWLFGPKAVLDPTAKELKLEQHPRSHTLSANVVVPGWWPYLTLGYAGIWSAFGSTTKDSAFVGSTQVRLVQNQSDLHALTGLLAGSSALRYPTIAEVFPREISACSDSDIEIRGDNIWRASAVMVGGRLYDTSAIAVSPDLGGITVRVKKSTDPLPAPPANNKVGVRVLTATGSIDAPHSITLNHADEHGRCKVKPEEQPAKKADVPAITSTDPAEISACATSPAFTITGSKMAGAIEVLLGSIVGSIERQATENDPTVRVSFTGAQLRKEFAGISKPNLVLRFPKGVKAEKEIQLIVPANCP